MGAGLGLRQCWAAGSRVAAAHRGAGRHRKPCRAGMAWPRQAEPRRHGIGRPHARERTGAADRTTTVTHDRSYAPPHSHYALALRTRTIAPRDIAPRDIAPRDIAVAVARITAPCTTAAASRRPPGGRGWKVRGGSTPSVAETATEAERFSNPGEPTRQHSAAIRHTTARCGAAPVEELMRLRELGVWG